MTVGAQWLAVLVGLGFCCVATWMATSVAIFAPLRAISKHSSSLDWAEKARLAHPLRATVQHALIWMPLYVTVMMTFYTDVAAITGWPQTLLTFPLPWIASALGVWLGGTRLENRVLQLEVSLKRWLQGAAVRIAFEHRPLALGIALGFAVPAHLGWPNLAVSVVASAIAWFLFRGAWEWALRKGLLHAEPETNTKNAFFRFAYPKSTFAVLQDRQAAILSKRAADVLDASQRAAYASVWMTAQQSITRVPLLHPLGLTAMAGVLTWSAVAAFTHRSVGEGLCVLAFELVALRLFTAWRRRQSHVPLQRAVSLHKDKASLAMALLRLRQDNIDPVLLVQDGASVDPLNDVYKRLLEAGITPDFRRPEPPPSSLTIRAVAWGVLVVVTAVVPLFLPRVT